MIHCGGQTGHKRCHREEKSDVIKIQIYKIIGFVTGLSKRF